ncbi:MAG: DUF2312 domain-containing protein [Alphaproteobacteria bacterium]
MAKTNLKSKSVEFEGEDEESAAPTNVSGARLKSFLERIERLEEEKKALSEDIRDVYAEAKGTGFEPKIMRKIISLRKANVEKRREEQELLDLYMAAIGMVE